MTYTTKEIACFNKFELCNRHFSHYLLNHKQEV